MTDMHTETAGPTTAPVAARATAFRHGVRQGVWTAPTSGAVPGALQANLAVMPAAEAEAFARYCALNPRPCPLLGQTAPGSRAIPALARDLDIARDLPAYRVLRDGRPAERVATLDAFWQPDTVAFALGCSFSFEWAMLEAGLPLRHAEHGRNVAMYVTAVETEAVPPFAGPMVVSMRPVPAARARELEALCAPYPFAHGTPVHVGDPSALGIADLARPDFGDPPVIAPGDVPAFWACGVTAQMALRHARLPLAFVHEPGHMLVTDLDARRPGLPAWAA